MSSPLLLDGKGTAAQIREELKVANSQRRAAGQRPPLLAAVLVGNDGGSESYVAHKIKACAEVGFESRLLRFTSDISQDELLSVVNGLNNDDQVDGFIVQLPLPPHIDAQVINLAIDPTKDVDGFHPVNVGRMALGLPTFLPATPSGICELLRRNGIVTGGMHAVILGRSAIVGSPLAQLLARPQEPGNCTVTLCHSRTQGLKEHCLRADLLVAAMGKPGFVKADMVKPGAVVVDVGTTRVEDRNRPSGFVLRGDVAFDEVAPLCRAITPVPGGVGPMTIASLLTNTWQAATAS
ncbi:MAG: bifunctional 5,10-methylene-tetrahydrofolate dehydrogenase/5,10-methylene-tetrahydrofolate cyclohydrolase [Sphingomonadales bacterium]|nr:bifunctional 5,10-methylene-tetrahydrofolate dehydrogenase/5,10-methylene-tetrahydrofolate cyclohydrolase [Sphingomonadales bacterium]MBM3923402.1 bifunctional 5,10-methylene-tetrahydrofolate dehydrogenase/5,10-methylene-tetrahydrofolate cyclohydrolase [Sphingomonadales bacterium]MBM3932251.1 bifunctional 5,10-methylene-tetrahydrofolate dehydrogenase/5,10-methylene-tetrahydrofolate cyclohydrolase [Sphingomonadales bacterium]